MTETFWTVTIISFSLSIRFMIKAQTRFLMIVYASTPYGIENTYAVNVLTPILHSIEGSQGHVWVLKTWEVFLVLVLVYLVWSLSFNLQYAIVFTLSSVYWPTPLFTVTFVFLRITNIYVVCWFSIEQFPKQVFIKLSNNRWSSSAYANRTVSAACIMLLI